MASHTPTWWTAGLAAASLSIVPSAPRLVDAALAFGWAVYITATAPDLWSRRPSADPTTLYRLYAEDGSLLYVGISRCLERRLHQHELTKPWWPQVSSIKTKVYRTRRAAAEAEWHAIETESPRHNATRLSREGHLRSAAAR